MTGLSTAYLFCTFPGSYGHCLPCHLCRTLMKLEITAAVQQQQLLLLPGKLAARSRSRCHRQISTASEAVVLTATSKHQADMAEWLLGVAGSPSKLLLLLLKKTVR